jgi:hypothetical protein
MILVPYRGRLPFAKLNLPQLRLFATRVRVRWWSKSRFVLDVLLKSLICCYARHEHDFRLSDLAGNLQLGRRLLRHPLTIYAEH